MVKILKNPHEVDFSYFESRFDLASMQLSSLSKFQPAVWKKEREGEDGYGIRILVKKAWNGYSGSTSYSWDYFYTNADGVIVQSPHGLGKEYNGRYRIKGLDKAVKKYKDKYINH